MYQFWLISNFLIDFNYYWQFLMKFKNSWPTQTRSNIKFSLGIYAVSTVFAPRGYKYRKNTPWNRLQRYYAKPRMTAAQPKLFNTVKSLLTYLPRYGVSSPSAGEDCILIWFWQDVPIDINQFLVPEDYDILLQLHDLCTEISID